MKTVSVPVQADLLNNLLKEALVEELILESADGQRFILAPLGEWESFEVNEDDDITGNKKLMEFLSKRKSKGKRIPLSEVRKLLDL